MIQINGMAHVILTVSRSTWRAPSTPGAGVLEVGASFNPEDGYAGAG